MVNESSRQAVKLAYQHNGDRPVAYIDESYRGPSEPGRKFYVMTAVVVAASVRDELRDGIVKIAGADYWHTAEAILTAPGLDDALYMLKFLNDGEEVCVVSIARSIDANDRDLEDARRASLAALLPALQAGSDNREPVRLVMIEQRHAGSERGHDERTKRSLTEANVLDRHFRMMQVSPRHEHLLWLPDLVCSSVRRHLVQQKADMLDQIRESIEFLAVEISNPRLP